VFTSARNGGVGFTLTAVLTLVLEIRLSQDEAQLPSQRHKAILFEGTTRLDLWSTWRSRCRRNPGPPSKLGDRAASPRQRLASRLDLGELCGHVLFSRNPHTEFVPRAPQFG
jgi:hypothetical protein